MPKKSHKNKHQDKRHPIRNFLIKILLLGVIWAGLIATLAILYYSRNLPDLHNIGGEDSTGSIRIIANNGELVASYGVTHAAYKKYQQFPKNQIRSTNRP